MNVETVDISEQQIDAVAQTVARLVDTSQVIELETLDPACVKGGLGYRFIKRAFDIVSCCVAVVILAIPMCVIAVLIKRDSEGPVFYRQERLGKDGEAFQMVKFRTMYVDAEANGPQWAEDDDQRVTSLGKKLRASRLDELPQFFQVITGKLSLVGPRPERPVFCEEFEKYIHGFNQRLLVRPGISGLAQVSGGYDLKPAEKAVYDLEYIKTRSVAMDADIILKTLQILFTHEGAR